MTNAGYVMIDFTGLNLNSSSKQTITGIYNKQDLSQQVY